MSGLVYLVAGYLMIFKNVLKKTIVVLSIIIGASLLAQLILGLLSVPEYLIPKPSSVLHVFFEKSALLMNSLYITMFESLSGFLLGNLFSICLASFLVLNEKLEKVGMSLAVVTKSIPIVALAPLFVIWTGNGVNGKIIMAALVCFFPMLINTIQGLKSVEQEILDYFNSLGANRWQLFTIVRIPTSIPYMIAAAKTSSTISIVGAIVAELSGSDQGVGHILLVSIYSLETDIMFAAIVCIAACGVAFYEVISYLERAYLSRFS